MQKRSRFLRLRVSFQQDNFDLICIQEQMHSPWSKPDNNGKNKRTSDANYSSCNNISTGFSCLPLDYQTGISHRNPEETLSTTQDTAYFNYLKTGLVNLPRLESYITCSNSIAKLNFLLACVDDIETNPGPENLSCSINQSTLNSPSDYDICWTSNDYNFCSSCLITLHYSFGVLCDTCNVWFHGWCHLRSLY